MPPLSWTAPVPGRGLGQSISMRAQETRLNVLEMLKKQTSRPLALEDATRAKYASCAKNRDKLHHSFCGTIPFFLDSGRRCCGISVTTMPGRRSKAVFNWNAV